LRWLVSEEAARSVDAALSAGTQVKKKPFVKPVAKGFVFKPVMTVKQVGPSEPRSPRHPSLCESCSRVVHHILQPRLLMREFHLVVV
jgi:hypothetical protein